MINTRLLRLYNYLHSDKTERNFACTIGQRAVVPYSAKSLVIGKTTDLCCRTVHQIICLRKTITRTNVTIISEKTTSWQYYISTAQI